MSQKKNQVVRRFKEMFDEPEYIIKAPGRANIIGEHVDYCGGLVLPFAIEQSMYFCVRSNTSKIMNIHAYDYNETYVVKDGALNSDRDWQKYFNQLFSILKQKDLEINGLDIVFGSEIPIGGGVSSSSAICCSLLLIINKYLKLNLTTSEMVDFAVEIEHGMGLKGGKMDQTTILLGKKDKAIFLDCQTEELNYIDLDLGDNYFLLLDTNVKHSLVDTEYNSRREEVESALQLVQKRHGPECTFRNISTHHISHLEVDHAIKFKRIRHVVSEIERVNEACISLKQKDYNNLGKLLNKSHASLTDDYAVSCKELDFLVSKLQTFDSVLGVRMMGGGFGGNVIALMSNNLTPNQEQLLKKEYVNAFGFEYRTLKVKASDGIEFL